jgi:LysR family glycine cleavage system transcriptional activator
MPLKLPSLNALRAFEAAGRHGSFAKAAEEMHVSAGAISRHVRLLEERLSLTLFDRRAQGLCLTEIGRTLLPEISEAFRRISGAVTRASTASNEIKVLVAATLAVRWLIPRLPEFQREYPHIHVSVGLCLDSEQFPHSSYDVGIIEEWWLDDIATNVDTRILRYERLTPVCSPALARRLRRPADLRKHPLLHALDTRDWDAWLAAAGEIGVPVHRGAVYRTGDAAARAAMSGKGVAIADIDLFKHEIDCGQLVAPFDLVLDDASPIVFFCTSGRLGEPNIGLLLDWLENSIRQDA